MANVLSVNLAHPRPNPDKAGLPTGIDKQPALRPVPIRAPGPEQSGLGSGLVGDLIGDQKNHGGVDQAVYAYAREDLDHWQDRLDRELTNGTFGENLTTEGVDVTGAVIGERWRVGADGVVLEVSRPRIPCRTFADWLALSGWVKTFTTAATPGAYLRIVESGTISAGDTIEIVDRPAHGVTIGMVFRAITLEPTLLRDILAADALADSIRQVATQRLRAG